MGRLGQAVSVRLIRRRYQGFDSAPCLLTLQKMGFVKMQFDCDFVPPHNG